MKKKLIIVVAVAVAGIGFYLFRPDALFTNRTVSESAIALAMKISSGSFVSDAHETMGMAEVVKGKNGKHFLRLSNFKTSNGPDVHVVLVAKEMVSGTQDVNDSETIDLGSIKGNIGDQNYELPAEFKAEKYKSVSIWCKRFGVNFGSASLGNATL